MGMSVCKITILQVMHYLCDLVGGEGGGCCNKLACFEAKLSYSTLIVFKLLIVKIIISDNNHIRLFPTKIIPMFKLVLGFVRLNIEQKSKLDPHVSLPCSIQIDMKS